MLQPSLWIEPTDDPLSTNLLQDPPSQELGSPHQTSGIGPLAAGCQQLDLAMELDGEGWGVLDESQRALEVEELGLDDELLSELLSEWPGNIGFIESNRVMDQTAFDVALGSSWPRDELRARQAG